METKWLVDKDVRLREVLGKNCFLIGCRSVFTSIGAGYRREKDSIYACVQFVCMSLFSLIGRP